MFCKHCGKEVLDDIFFCPHCGGAVLNNSKKKSKTSLMLGIIGMVAWIIPIIGFPIQITGLVLGIKELKTTKGRVAMVGVVLCIVGLILTSINASIGAYNAILRIENDYDYEYDNFSILEELEISIQPIGYFSKPALYDTEDIDTEEWLSYIKYDEQAIDYYNKENTYNQQLKIRSAIVKIICESDDGSYRSGSGTNILPGGYIVTNLHVVEEATELGCVVGLPDPETGLIREAYWATPIIDKENKAGHDLAILSVEDPVIDEEYNIYGFYERIIEMKFPYYEESDECLNDNLQLGDKIFVFGYPYLSGGALTITDGIISSLYSADGYLITSAKISPGNSGGLAIDSNGCFVGVPTAVYSEEQSESYGEIIDAYFVYEFYEAMIDYIFEHIGVIEEDIFQKKEQSYLEGESNVYAYLSVPGALRACASTDCQIIRYYAEGAKVTIEDINGASNWYKIVARDDIGSLITGYMHSSLFE